MFKRDGLSSEQGDERDEKFIPLQSWRAGSENVISITRNILLLTDPKETVTLNFLLQKKKASSNGCEEDFKYTYKLDLIFYNSDIKLKQKYVYQVSFQMSCTKSTENKVMQWDRLFEHKQIRTDEFIQFTGEFTSEHLYLGSSPYGNKPVDYNLYCYLARYKCIQEVDQAKYLCKNESYSSTKLEEPVPRQVSKSEAKANLQQEETKLHLQDQNFQISAGSVKNKVQQFQERDKRQNSEMEMIKNSITSHVSEPSGKLKQLNEQENNVRVSHNKFNESTIDAVSLEETVERLKIEVENQRRLYQGEMTKNRVLTSRTAELTEKVHQLEETEHNLLAQLQQSEQQAYRQAQESDGKIQQLEMSMKNLNARFETRIEELAETFKCCICCVNQVNIVWIPCGHAKFCDKCVNDNRRRGVQPNDCMICRQSGESYKLIL